MEIRENQNETMMVKINITAYSIEKAKILSLINDQKSKQSAN